jgi:hypothetical protein
MLLYRNGKGYERSAQRANPPSLNLCGYGTLQKRDRYHQPPFAFELSHSPLYSRQRTPFYNNFLSDLQERARPHRSTRPKHHPYRLDFNTVNWDRLPADAHHMEHTRRGHHGPAKVRVEIAEDIPGKEWLVDVFNPVRPPLLNSVRR